MSEYPNGEESIRVYYRNEDFKCLSSKLVRRKVRSITEDSDGHVSGEIHYLGQDLHVDFSFWDGEWITYCGWNVK